MKYNNIIVFLFFSVLAFSQGIEFEKKPWKEVLEKSQQTGKPIFLDVYTSWCGPCKKMNNEIFPLAEVGKAYNSNFICYGVDAEKGEGIEIAKKYKVMSYPTYLFIKADGTLFSKGLGSMAAEKFIALSGMAISDLNDPKPLAEWDSEYVTKKNDPGFLLGYMNKRAKIGLSYANLFDEYLALLPNDQRASEKVIEIYQKESRNITIHSLAYKNLQDNKNMFFPKLGGHVYIYIMGAIGNSFKLACNNKDEQLLQEVIVANNTLPKTPQSKTQEELYTNYYKATNNLEQYIKYATLYCNTSLMTISTDSITLIDKKALQLFDSTQKNQLIGKIDSAQIVAIGEYMAHASRNQYSTALNDIAWRFFEKVSDSNALMDALRWSKRSLEIYPQNDAFLDTYANLLYKLGRREEAILNETEALNITSKAKKDTKHYEKVLTQMRAGEKTW